MPFGIFIPLLSLIKSISVRFKYSRLKKKGGDMETKIDFKLKGNTSKEGRVGKQAKTH
jgi:hypothetical protein